MIRIVFVTTTAAMIGKGELKMLYRVTVLIPVTFEQYAASPSGASSLLLMRIADLYKKKELDASVSYNKGILLKPVVHSVSTVTGNKAPITPKKST
jgi:hypothetical protein